MLTVGLVFIVQTLSFMNCSCNFICGLSDVIIKTFSQSVSQSVCAFSALTLFVARLHLLEILARWKLCLVLGVADIGVGSSNLVGIIDLGVDACGILCRLFCRSVGQTNRK